MTPIEPLFAKASRLLRMPTGRIAGLFVVAWSLIGPSSLNASGKLKLDFIPEWNGRAMQLNQNLSGTSNHFSISRLDGLLSRLAVQRRDGTWVESEKWYLFFSPAKGQLTALADGLPAEEFQAIRFQVGLDPHVNSSDPHSWPAGHALHPDTSGLHWGWQSGYVFLAIEGHNSSHGSESGFAYHLAGKSPMEVRLPVQFSGRAPTTIRIGLDVSLILDSGNVLREGASTHSRPGDALAERLAQRTARAFAVKDLQRDLYQPAQSIQAAGTRSPAGTTPLAMAISERLPRVTLPADNPLTVEGVELGRRLFHERLLSRNNAQSCASCHDRSLGFTDGLTNSVGVAGRIGRRNAMPLVNLAWAQEFFWDGRAKSLREQVLMPIQDAHEMNESLDAVMARLRADNSYPELFEAAFGTPGIDRERLALALEQFLLTLVSQDSRFDRAARKLARLTPQEQRGLELFVTEHDPARGLRGADCFHCHGGNLFSNHQFMNNGLVERLGDLGRMEVTKAPADRGKFKVPTLRNVALTAPYMHDGRFATLEEVVEHYDSKVQRSRTLDPSLAKHPETGLGLSAEDKAALVAFLKTLTDEQFSRSEESISKVSTIP